MPYSICLLSVVPMRKEPSHRSEMISQLLFGDFVQTAERQDDFIQVHGLADGYEGWVQASQLTSVHPDETETANVFTVDFLETVTIGNGPVHLPFGSPVYVTQNQPYTKRFGQAEIIYTTDEKPRWSVNDRPWNAENLKAAYTPYLGTPYLWGGKSVFGIDCSGFAQQVFKLFGVKLLRDAYLQANQGGPVANLALAQCGDLAFFHNEKGRITHVGILLSNKEIIHASGKVRIDAIDEVGILQRDTGNRTHQLHSIRRFF